MRSWHPMVLSRASAITAVVGSFILFCADAGRARSAPQPPPRQAVSYVKMPVIHALETAKPLDPFRAATQPLQCAILPLLPEGFIKFLDDQNSLEKARTLQIGVHRTFDHPLVVDSSFVHRDQWTFVTNGSRILSVHVSSPGAIGLRLHFVDVALPSRSQIIIYDPANPFSNNVTVAQSSLTPDFWSPTLFSDQAIVECQLPPGADPESVTFTISGLSHIYKAPPANFEKEGSCEVDVSCFPNWSQESDGVALIAYVSGGNTYMCSGCLLASTSATSAEYFLTAKHCIPNQTEASTLEFYWLFQTPGCNAAPPSLSSVATTTGGADLLAVGDNDFSFLRLHRAAPGGVTYLGWSVNPPAT